MPLTSHQQIPNKQVESQPWSFKRIFSRSGVSTISKVFTNPFDWMVLILAFLATAIEIAGENSVYCWIAFTLALTADIIERRKPIQPIKKEPKK